MRPFEILILATILLMILGFFIPANARTSWGMTLPMVTSVFIVLHLFFEGYRWQMIPAYGLFIILLFTVIASITMQLPTPAPIWRVVEAVCGLFLSIIVVGLPLIFPIFRLPAPIGPYAVGTTRFVVLEHTDAETVTENLSDHNDIVVQAWYPAEATTGKPSAYLAHAPFPWDWLHLVPTHAYLDAPLSGCQDSYPPLIFNHGGGFMAVQNTIQMQELASHGYVVFSISHSYDSVVTIYPDGRTDGRSFAQLWRDMTPVIADNNRASSTTAALRYANGGGRLSLDEKKVIMQKVFAENTVARAVINRRTEDTRAVIDYLESLNMGTQHHLFTGRLDINRLGIFGHSNGGAVAVNVAINDSRVKAVINMDGYIFGDVFNAGLQQPFMTMNKDGDQGRDDVVYQQAKTQAYTVTILGANHFNFMDIYLWVPLLNARYLGLIDPQRAVEIMNRYTRAFFDKHLRNKDVPLLDGFANKHAVAVHRRSILFLAASIAAYGDGATLDYPEVLFDSRSA